MESLSPIAILVGGILIFLVGVFVGACLAQLEHLTCPWCGTSIGRVLNTNDPGHNEHFQNHLRRCPKAEVRS